MNKISFYLYKFIITAFYFLGFIYISRSEFMPYHSVALGLSWQQLDPALQVLILAGIRGVGGIMVSIATALMFILHFPFKAQQLWAKIALPLVCLLTILTLTSIALSVKFQTPAMPPLIPLMVLFGLLCLAVIFTKWTRVD